jgi:hypothetical protein
MVKPTLLERLRLKKRKSRDAFMGVGWYNRESWAQMKKTATDPQRFEATFDEWLIMAEDALRNFAMPGGLPTKVMINPEEFFAWCKARRTRNNAAARARSFRRSSVPQTKRRPEADRISSRIAVRPYRRSGRPLARDRVRAEVQDGSVT